MRRNHLGFKQLFHSDRKFNSRHQNLRKNSLILFFNWFVNSGTYYGLSLSTSDLGGNPYINFLISAAVEIPANLLVLLVLNRFGRKIPLCLFMLLAGVTLLATGFIAKDQVKQTQLPIRL